MLLHSIYECSNNIAECLIFSILYAFYLYLFIFICIRIKSWNMAIHKPILWLLTIMLFIMTDHWSHNEAHWKLKSTTTVHRKPFHSHLSAVVRLLSVPYRLTFFMKGILSAMEATKKGTALTLIKSTWPGQKRSLLLRGTVTVRLAQVYGTSSTWDRKCYTDWHEDIAADMSLAIIR